MNLIPLTIANSVIRIGEHTFAVPEPDAADLAPGTYVTLAVPESALTRVTAGGAEGEVADIMDDDTGPIAVIRLSHNVLVTMPTDEHVAPGMHIRIAIDPEPCELIAPDALNGEPGRHLPIAELIA